MTRRATSQDVADRAGVSRSAVSLVLNGRGAGNISAANQAAILAAARELDYRPNPVALSLRTQRSATIGVVTDAIASAGYAGRLLQGASERAAAHGYLLLVIDTQRDPSQEARAFDTLRDRQVDGFLFAAMSLRSYEPSPVGSGAPIVLANCFDPDDRVLGFVPDEVAGGAAAARHLVERGHRDIVLLAGTPDVVATHLREQGYLEVMAAAGLAVPPSVVGGWDIEQGHAAATHVLTTRDPLPTALICANDRAAAGAVLAAANLGLSVPGDLSVVGYDDDQNVAPTMVPALTTVRLPHREMGEAAIQALLDRLVGGADSPIAGRVLLDCPLVVRDSVAAPAPRPGR
jgi:LacI family transcriptional regulator